MRDGENLQCLGPTLLPDNYGIIEEVPQDEPQGGDGQGKEQKFILERKPFVLSQTSEA